MRRSSRLTRFRFLSRSPVRPLRRGADAAWGGGGAIVEANLGREGATPSVVGSDVARANDARNAFQIEFATRFRIRSVGLKSDAIFINTLFTAQNKVARDYVGKGVFISLPVPVGAIFVDTSVRSRHISSAADLTLRSARRGVIPDPRSFARHQSEAAPASRTPPGTLEPLAPTRTRATRVSAGLRRG